MSSQASLGDFGAVNTSLNDAIDEDSQRSRPLPATELGMLIHRGVDRRELLGTGLAPCDLDPLGAWQFQSGLERVRRVATGEVLPYHPDDRQDPEPCLGQEMAIARDLARVVD